VGTPPPAFSPLVAGPARVRRGLAVHALLARLPEIAPERRRAVAHAFLLRQGFTAPAADALTEETMAVLDDADFAFAFAPDSRAEVGLVADLPQLGQGARLNGRVDRLAVTADAVTILDFKTGRPPSREADVSPVHLAQMALYRVGATRIFPGRRIVCGLVFTEGPQLMRLSDAALDAEMARIGARLDRAEGRS
jgi:ATP-dependent helicase/nuclease subunit A